MPKKLFISYPSESWNFAQRIAEKLAEWLDDSIFIDYRSIDQADFAEAILTHLRASDGVVLVVTEFTFADIHRDRDWVRLEIRTALENDIPIILVRENGLLPPSDIPDDVQDVRRSQGVPFYREFFDPGVALLADFLIKIGIGTLRTANSAPKLVETSPAPVAPTATTEPAQRMIGGQGSLEEAADLLEAGDHEKALVILETMRAQGNLRPVIANAVADLLAEAERRRGEAERRHEASLDYSAIAAMARRKITEARAREEFHAWCVRFPDLVDALDNENLRERFPQFNEHDPNVADWLPDLAAIDAPDQEDTKSSIPLFDDDAAPNAQSVSALLATVAMGELDGENVYTPPTIPDWLNVLSSKNLFPPPFAWIEIPGTGYSIAKYPVTNAQFARFVEAGGYSERKWWTRAGWDAKARGWVWDEKKRDWTPTNNAWTQPRFWLDSKWNGAEQPVVGVSWYEAVAYCLWLSDATNEKIMLLTEDQWQYAAQGDDGRNYPWGNEWDSSRCNNNVNSKGIGKTTPVRQYEGKGDSPFGVVDMAGNVWEWCLTDFVNKTNDANNVATYRVLRGGSWNSNYTDTFRCDNRNGNASNIRDDGRGFRLSLSS